MTAAQAVERLGALAGIRGRAALDHAPAAALSFATVLTLAWTVPWYVWWVLPFAALARGRTLRLATVAVTVGLALGAMPQSTQLIHDFGYYPTRTPVGHADHAEFERLLH